MQSEDELEKEIQMELDALQDNELDESKDDVSKTVTESFRDKVYRLLFRLKIGLGAPENQEVLDCSWPLGTGGQYHFITKI